MHIPSGIRNFIKDALVEDIGSGDITTSAIIDPTMTSEAVVTTRSDIILCGQEIFALTFKLIEKDIHIETLKKDTETAKKGDVIAKLKGRTSTILMGERVALNILQRLCGITTMTSAYVREIEGLPVRLVDTRKTTPNMRFLEKYAVRCGGGYNHRFGLYDGILIKDNHIKAAGGIKDAIRLARTSHHLLKIEVEVTNRDELHEAVSEGIEVIMLDNMTVDEMKEAVTLAKKINPNVLIEASGSVTLKNIREIALTGVDIISSGSLTHSVQAADISLNII